MRALGSRPETLGRPHLLDIFLLLWATAVFGRDVVVSISGHVIPATLVVLSQPFWLYRWWNSDTSWPTDLLICLSLDYWRKGGIYLLRSGFLHWLEETQYAHRYVYFILTLCAISSGIIVVRGEGPSREPVEPPKKTNERPLPPLLIPSRTTHSRIFPRKHSFSYSYFYVGVPVGWKGCVTSMLSADVELLDPNEQRYGWFHINATDYLERGDKSLGLEGKLRRYLHGQVSTYLLSRVAR